MKLGVADMVVRKKKAERRKPSKSTPQKNGGMCLAFGV
jgi:hypothetical protein